MIRMITLLAMLYGLWDLFPAVAQAQPAAASLKTIAAYWYVGSRPISGVDCYAYVVPPADSIQFATNSNGAVYAAGVPIDSSQSGADGKMGIRVPLTSNITPTGTRIRLVYTYRGQTIFDTQNLPDTANLALTDTTWTCLQKITKRASTCP